jgi:hypothetical protein
MVTNACAQCSALPSRVHDDTAEAVRDGVLRVPGLALHSTSAGRCFVFALKSLRRAFLPFDQRTQQTVQAPISLALYVLYRRFRVKPLGGCDSAVRRGKLSAPLELAAHSFGCAGGVI